MTRRGPIAAAAVACAVMGLLATAGCAGSSDPSDTREAQAPTASSSPSPARVRTVDELAAALPRTSQVPTASKKTGACPGDASCVDGTVSVSMRLKRPVDAAEQERLAADEFVSDFVQVVAKALPDDDAAAAALQTSRDQAARYVGAFDLPYKDTSETTYTPAEKGEGTSDDLTVEGWTGFEAARDQVFADAEGRGSEKRYQVGQVHLVDGTSMISVYVTVMSEPRGAGAASELARGIATDYIARLD